MDCAFASYSGRKLLHSKSMRFPIILESNMSKNMLKDPLLVCSYHIRKDKENEGRKHHNTYLLHQSPLVKSSLTWENRSILHLLVIRSCDTGCKLLRSKPMRFSVILEYNMSKNMQKHPFRVCYYHIRNDKENEGPKHHNTYLLRQLSLVKSWLTWENRWIVHLLVIRSCDTGCKLLRSKPIIFSVVLESNMSKNVLKDPLCVCSYHIRKDNENEGRKHHNT